MIDLSKMTTEQVNPNTVHLSAMSIREAITTMNQEDYNAVKCIESQIDMIEKVITITSDALENGGRIIYIGAGTSGRLGLLDAVECPPTFGVDYNTVVGLIAGGDNAFVKAVEGAEDSKQFAVDDLKKIGLNEKDVVIGVAASGRLMSSAVFNTRQASMPSPAVWFVTAAVKLKRCASIRLSLNQGLKF